MLICTSPSAEKRGHGAASTKSRAGHLCLFAFALGVLGCWPAAADAQGIEEWPARPVRVIVPYGSGGVGDLLGRLTTDRLAKVFGQPFVLEMRPGGGGVVGTESVVRSPNDGYTLMIGSGALFSVVPLMQKLNYDPLKDLTPISIVAMNGMALAVNNDLPIHSVTEFIAYAKANPGKLNYGSGGVGTSSHLVPAAFAARTGLEMVAIPYQSTPASIVGVISGDVQVFFGNVPDIVESARGGRVRLLGLSTADRIPQFPDMPTIAETVPGFVMTAWNGYFAPAGTPQSIIQRLSRAVAAICREPEVVTTLTNRSLKPVGNTPEEFFEIIRQELPVYAEAVTAAGLRRK
jgi:tripartite-type tricarboxylate transporter receptor subunit TctC